MLSFFENHFTAHFNSINNIECDFEDYTKHNDAIFKIDIILFNF